jgi:hypothetical protein
MKKFWLSLIVLLVILLGVYIVLGKRSGASDDWSTREVRDMNISIQYPSTWKIEIKHSEGDSYKEAEKSRIKPYTYIDIVPPGINIDSTANTNDDYVEILPGTCDGVFEATCNDGLAKGSNVTIAIWSRSENANMQSQFKAIIQKNLTSVVQ